MAVNGRAKAETLQDIKRQIIKKIKMTLWLYSKNGHRKEVQKRLLLLSEPRVEISWNLSDSFWIRDAVNADAGL